MKLFRYTVIEMIAVISIGAVLMAVSVPAFSHLLRGNAPGMAARELMGKLASARSYAAANRTYVAVVFPRTESGVNKKYSYVTYRICQVTVEGTDYKWEKWLGNWNHLPLGVLITATFDTPANYPNEGTEKGSSTSTALEVKNCEISDMTGDTPNGDTTRVDLENAVIFSPRGLTANNKSVRIPIQMGVTEVSDSGVITTVFDKNYVKSGKPYRLPLIVRVTGKAVFYDTLLEEP